jgi:hypothetical protein
MILIVVLVGIAFATSVADSIYEQSNTYKKTNESIYLNATRFKAQPTVYSNISIAIANNKLSSAVITMYNATNGKLITTGNYTVNLTGLNKGYNTYSIYLINSSQWGAGKENITYITYNYYPESYVPYSNARTILGLIVLFMALMILLIVIDYVLDGELRALVAGR